MHTKNSENFKKTGSKSHISFQSVGSAFACLGGPSEALVGPHGLPLRVCKLSDLSQFGSRDI